MDIIAAAIQKRSTKAYDYNWNAPSGDNIILVYYVVYIYKLTRFPGGQLIWKRDWRTNQPASFRTKEQADQYIIDRAFIKLNRPTANSCYFWYKEGDI